MSKKHPILFGAFILTAAGFLSRIIGFFFRIFLSQNFGEEQVGLYQLIFPLYALCFSFTSAGIETSISRCVAQKKALNRPQEVQHVLFTGLGISLFLSIFMLLFLQHYASNISISILGDIRCEPLLVAISYAIPLAAIHSCICGYYFGLKQAQVPALSQLIEQSARVISVYIIYQIAQKHNFQIHILFAVFGIVIGEFFSAFFCIKCFSKESTTPRNTFANFQFISTIKEILHLSIPLTSNRILLNLLQSIESISIPLRLQQYGYSNSDALINYGVLTGMALPCIFFPSAITSSVSTMLLPIVTEIQTSKDYQKLKKIIFEICISCISLGLLCCILFVLFSNWIGNFLFHSTLATRYLQTLAWICPFLYSNNTLTSVTNGLGKTSISFFINTVGLLIRITGIIIFIPLIGMNGYLYSLLISQSLAFFLYFSYLLFYTKRKTSPN